MTSQSNGLGPGDPPTVVQRIHQHSRDRPDALAVRCVSGDQLTYGDLWWRSDQLALHLLDIGVQPEDRLAVLSILDRNS